MSSENGWLNSHSHSLSNISARQLVQQTSINESLFEVGQKKLLTSLACDASPVSCSVKWLAVAIIVEVAFGLGCSIDFDASKDRGKFKAGLGIPALVHFLVKPLVTFAWIKIFKFVFAPVVALLVTMSLPGGHISYFLTYLLKGDVALSAVIGVAFTLLSFVFLPFNLYVYASHWLLGKHAIDDVIAYPSILLVFLFMTIPLGFGVLISKFRPRAASAINKVFHVILLLTTSSFVALAAIEEKEELYHFQPDNIWLVYGLTPLLGLACGIILTTLLRQNNITSRTVTVDSMTQNGPLAAAILRLVFPSNFIGAYYLLPLLYSVFQFLEALLFVAIMRYKQKMEEEEKENAFFALGGVPVGRIRRISMHTIDRIRRSFTRSRSSDVSDQGPQDVQQCDDDDQEVFGTSARRHNILNTAITEEEEEQSTSSHKNDSKKRKKQVEPCCDLPHDILSSMNKEEASQFEDVSISSSKSD